MGKLDELKNKAKEMVTENRDKIEGGLDKAGEMVNKKTGGKYEDKIDKGLAKAQEGLDRAESNTSGGETQNSAETPTPPTMPGTTQPAPPNMPPPPGPPGA